MKVIIAGSRQIDDYNIVVEAINESEFCITEVVSGTARGVDSIGEEYAMIHNIKVKKFKPMWNLYGKKAGILRNIKMAEYADALIAIWDGSSIGTKHMIEFANERGLKVHTKIVEDT